MFHGHLLKIRIHKKFVKAIFLALAQDKEDDYSSLSHWVRCAIIEKLKNDNIIDQEGKF